ncbi:WD40 repeat domain-containing serine/threonine protein kinase [Streptomyces sp. NPDC005791]|uniref:WD40 repeat domain-containing serine/threonine protein kinase n=1 Tax=Streptomyces sp. NPDC005791 TaxID=3364732 RepID=UPI0036A56B6E
MEPLRADDPERIGSYRLRGRLGAGGMGVVFLGVSPGGRKVAVKVIRAELAQTPSYRARFAREVEVARRVGGFHTAQVVDADTEAEAPWLVTAFIDGPSLHAVVTEGGPLSAGEVLALAAGLAEGLGAIHAGDLVHRDLKPGNVIMAADGPRIIDFGIAQVADAGAFMTTTGVVLGTPSYTSPEQVRGQSVGPAADVFSLGSVLAFAATGRSPFAAPTLLAISHRICNETPDLDGVSGELRALIEACLAKDPESRPGPVAILSALAGPEDATEVLTRLRETSPLTLLAEPPPPTVPTSREPAAQPPSAPPVPEFTGPTARGRRALSRRGFVFGAVGLVGAVAAGGATWLLWPEAGELTDDSTSGIAFSRDGRTLISTHPASAGMVRFWDVGSEERTAAVDGDTTGAGFPVVNPDGKTFAMNEADQLVLRDVRTGVVVDGTYALADRADMSVFAADPDITCFTVSPDGKLLVIGTSTDGPAIVDIADREVVANLVPEDHESGRPVRGVNELAFSPDGKRLAVAGSLPSRDTDWISMEKHGCTVWDVARRRVLSVLLAEPTSSVAFGATGNTVATAGEAGVRLWDVNTGDIRSTFTAEQTHALAFGQDGKALLTAGMGGVRLWDTGTGRLTRELSDKHVQYAAFSPDGKAVAAAGEDESEDFSPGCWLWKLD